VAVLRLKQFPTTTTTGRLTTKDMRPDRRVSRVLPSAGNAVHTNEPPEMYCPLGSVEKAAMTAG
jgi:hypothetical protein